MVVLVEISVVEDEIFFSVVDSVEDKETNDDVDEAAPVCDEVVSIVVDPVEVADVVVNIEVGESVVEVVAVDDVLSVVDNETSVDFDEVVATV